MQLMKGLYSLKDALGLSSTCLLNQQSAELKFGFVPIQSAILFVSSMFIQGDQIEGKNMGSENEL